MINSKLVYAVIPSRGGSKRLHRKNVTPIWGQPMLYWAIRACKQSAYIDECYVSTEDAEVAKLAEQFQAKVIHRPAKLADDLAFKQDVIAHAAETFEKNPEIVVSLQPNSPEVCAKDLDAAIRKLVENDRNEIFSVDAQLIQNAAFRIMKYEYVFQKSLSTRSGVFVTNYVDVHTAEDFETLARHRHPCDETKKEINHA